MLNIWKMQKSGQQGPKKPKVKAAALRIQKDLSDLDMSQYPTMKLIFADGKTPAAGPPSAKSGTYFPNSEASKSGSDFARSGSGGTSDAAGAPGTPGTPQAPKSGSGTGRSGSGGTTEEIVMSKEEEERKLHFRLEITPDDGYYVGGVFKFRFDIPDNYPHDPPKVKCEQKIYHPNIDLEGNICLNILREDWKPVLNLNSVLVGLQYLFLEPNPDDPLNKEAAEIQKRNKSQFIQNISTTMGGGSIRDGHEYDYVKIQN